jgi:hypothetical protein
MLKKGSPEQLHIDALCGSFACPGHGGVIEIFICCNSGKDDYTFEVWCILPPQ